MNERAMRNLSSIQLAGHSHSTNALSKHICVHHRTSRSLPKLRVQGETRIPAPLTAMSTRPQAAPALSDGQRKVTAARCRVLVRRNDRVTVSRRASREWARSCQYVDTLACVALPRARDLVWMQNVLSVASCLAHAAAAILNRCLAARAQGAGPGDSQVQRSASGRSFIS